MYRQRISSILAKLDQARATPGLETRFGVAQHQFRLRPPISATELENFERHHGIGLPDDHRQFLLLAGNGGAGPFYGIEPLSKWAENFEEEAESPGFLSSPCPLVVGAALKQAWDAALERDALRAKGTVSVGASPNRVWKPFVAPDWPEWGRGSIYICDQGCTYSARLIVSGEARGRIVYLDAQEWYPPYFVTALNFIDWYERWLDTALRNGPDGWFGLDVAAV
jgi:hypothetical protein